MHSYPKIYAIGHAAIADLFADDVLVEEKVDGSQFSFKRENGLTSMRSRGAEVFPGNAGMFTAAEVTVRELSSDLREGWTYRAEYLAKPKHNVLAYSRTPARNLIIFDINCGEELYLNREEKEQEAARLGLEIVPVMYYGRVENPEQVYTFLERESVLGGGKVEGVVVKNYSRFGVDKKVLMGKYVSEAFKEKHTKEWKSTHNMAISDVIERIIAALRHERRWEKAVERLRDAGLLESSPRDIGLLMKSAQEDIKEEELEYIREMLVTYALPRILRASTSGLPEWYKKRLLESAFVPSTDESAEPAQ